MYNVDVILDCFVTVYSARASSVIYTLSLHDALPISSLPAWNGWGNDASNSRFQNAKAAGLAAADVPKLTLKWALDRKSTRLNSCHLVSSYAVFFLKK